ACFAVSAGATGAAPWWFSTLLLLGVAITVTAALSTDAADALALAMPLGPQTVLLARLTTVLGVDALAGLAASAAFAWWGAPLGFGAVVLSWLAPLAAVAGVSAFVSGHRLAKWAAASRARQRLGGAVGRGRRRDGGGAGRVAERDRARGRVGRGLRLAGGGGCHGATGDDRPLGVGMMLGGRETYSRRFRMGASDRAARGGSASGAWWALLDAQARRVRVVGIAVPLATAVLIAIAGSCWALAAGPASAALAMGDHAAKRRRCGHVRSGRVYGDALVELHASTPTEFRGRPARGRAVGSAVAGGFALFAPLHLAKRSTATLAVGASLAAAARGAGRVCGGAFRVDARDDARRDARLAVLRVDMGSEHGVDAGAAARVAVARAARRRRAHGAPWARLSAWISRGAR
ncbi:MAG: hypothetical protein ACLTMP_05655, partial [Eggerthella lenta]